MQIDRKRLKVNVSITPNSLYFLKKWRYIYPGKKKITNALTPVVINFGNDENTKSKIYDIATRKIEILKINISEIEYFFLLYFSSLFCGLSLCINQF